MLFCIDSDGCVFDNMRWKHEHAFLPAFIEVWNLEQWRDLAEKHWYHINLYSQTRGINRFAGFAHCLQRLRQEGNPDLQGRLPDLGDFERLIANPANLNANAIRNQLDQANDREPFEKALQWSEQVNRLIAAKSTPHMPFAQAECTLHHMAAIGEVHVVSQAPHDTLRGEWEQAGLASLATSILGQEFGSKSAQVHLARNNRAIPSLLVGDAPRDKRSADAANALFFPINPQQEDASWKVLEAILNQTQLPLLQEHEDYKTALDQFHRSLGRD